MTIIESFQAIADKNARILVLGSIPGIRSLQDQQYYAHPRNQFWPIICKLLSINPDSAYVERLNKLTLSGVALWDVMKRCRRPGSMDSDIDFTSVVINDFDSFFESHGKIEAILFNGATADKIFNKHYYSEAFTEKIKRYRLPSTSPANAAMSFEQKLENWRVLPELLNRRLQESQ
ncbi:DNA-deoxyinosine glycosylase [Methylomonas sp. UP202]|uniref:DNA-deoxyinosine glycosylase n=1 Tax=Methylomonas sp. UP202 TaxID=3040943 RepID=UPI002479C734|nr:DNA-deoxyinosine glycosylase [Methylomonas sp. UP202]WGS86874.1 DNA-deoxyinosine glycosylase [Methylomonas sp. UP202]